MGNDLRISRTGNVGGRVRRRPKRRYIGKRKVRVMAKLDESKVRYILSQRRKGVPTGEIAETMGVSARWIRRLCARYRNVDLKDVTYPMRMGRAQKRPARAPGAFGGPCRPPDGASGSDRAGGGDRGGHRLAHTP